MDERGVDVVDARVDVVHLNQLVVRHVGLRQQARGVVDIDHEGAADEPRRGPDPCERRWVPVDHGDHPVDRGAGAHLRPGKGLDQRLGQGQAGGLDHDMVGRLRAVLRLTAVAAFLAGLAARLDETLEHLQDAGANVGPSGCAACLGGPEDTFGRLNEPIQCISTTNRNFDRRMGAPGDVYLVSPAVAAATAVTGTRPSERCVLIRTEASLRL